MTNVKSLKQNITN